MDRVSYFLAKIKASNYSDEGHIYNVIALKSGLKRGTYRMFYFIVNYLLTEP